MIEAFKNIPVEIFFFGQKCDDDKSKYLKRLKLYLTNYYRKKYDFVWLYNIKKQSGVFCFFFVFWTQQISRFLIIQILSVKLQIFCLQIKFSNVFFFMFCFAVIKKLFACTKARQMKTKISWAKSFLYKKRHVKNKVKKREREKVRKRVNWGSNKARMIKQLKGP